MKISIELQNLLKDSEIQELLNQYKFEDIYTKILLESNFNASTISELTELCLESGINPLNYMDYVPEFFLSASERVTDFDIPDNVKEIKTRAFNKCYNLKSINIGKNVTTIDNDSFNKCKNLKSINIPDSVTKIKSCAFMDCENLESITLPNTILDIGFSVFEGCYNLKSIIIPDNISIIWDYLFYECGNLTSVTLPRKIREICTQAFYKCTNLTSINYKGTMAQWDNIKCNSSWRESSSIRIIHCIDGDIEL